MLLVVLEALVSDHVMTTQIGLEFLGDIKEINPDLPFIFYTGKDSKETTSNAISAGVTDCFRKESDSSHCTVLANRIENTVETYYTQRELDDQEQRLSLFLSTPRLARSGGTRILKLSG